MSNSPQMRRPDRLMSDAQALDTLAKGFCGRLATLGPDGFPYCIPLLYVWMNGEVFVHNTAEQGHLRANVNHHPLVCFEIDESGEVFDYGRFECDVSISYRSVVAFGRIRAVQDVETKQHFCEALLAKYGKPDTGRPKGFFPRLNIITVYAITLERITGKEQPLPGLSEQWPAKDRTKTPHARPPELPTAEHR
jgi:nitroimidazol reductase NimA-like FMN-containing flavoprotein (pyridoxamine 5'-phosphate oxidase superfamily)